MSLNMKLLKELSDIVYFANQAWYALYHDRLQLVDDNLDHVHKEVNRARDTLAKITNQGNKATE